MPHIQVRVKQVTGLHDSGKHYVEVKVNEQSAFKTHSVKGMNPSWNVEKTITFDDPNSAKLHFLVWADKPLAKDKVVAHLACYVRDLKYRVPTPCTVPMKATSTHTQTTNHSINFSLELLALDFGHHEGATHASHHAPVAVDNCVQDRHVEQHCDPCEPVAAGTCYDAVDACEPVHVEPVCATEAYCEPSPCVDAPCSPVQEVCVERDVHVEQQPVMMAPPPVQYVPPPQPAVAPVVMVRVQDSRLEEELRRVEMRRRQQRASHHAAVEESLRRRRELEDQLAELEHRHHALLDRERHAPRHHDRHRHGHHHDRYIVEEFDV